MKIAASALLVTLIAVGSAQTAPPNGYLLRKGEARRTVEGLAIESTFAYPEFGRRIRVAPTANPRLRRTVEEIHQTFLAEATKLAHEIKGRMTGPFTSQVGARVHLNSSDLVSVQFVIYQYLGGAHGMTRFETRNFGRIGGRVRPLELADFFAPGTDPVAVIGPKILAKARQTDGATWVRSGEVARLSKADLRHFVATRDGLVFFFEPYLLGPYSSGSFEFRLSSAELGPAFRRGLLPK
ncbi:MAG: DUF3298 and DUF4163 domain-containing protein [Fimbriimonadaceae bacterium]